jgi:hypothetical protein
MKKLVLLFSLLIPAIGFAQSYSIDWYKIAGIIIISYLPA